MAIRLYTGRRGDHMSKIFLMVIFFCMSHELLLGANKDFELKFEEFEKNPFLKPDPFSSTLKLDKEKLKEIVNMGVPIIPKIIDKLRKNSSSGVAITIITYLTKIQFEFIYDENKCIYTYNDYNVNDTENLSFKRSLDDLYKYFNNYHLCTNSFG